MKFLDGLITPVISQWSSEPLLGLGFGAILAGFAYASFGAVYGVLYPARRDRPLITLSKTLIFLWLMALTCVIAWSMSGRDGVALGLGAGEGWRALLAWVLALAASAYTLITSVTGTSRQEGREKIARSVNQSPGLQGVIPRTRTELILFCAVAVSAGITEEIIFRGFVLEVLGFSLPVWGAALASAVLFIAFHAYQGVAGMVRITPITLILTALVLIGETLWPAIILHACVDLSAAVLFWRCKSLLAPAPHTPRSA